MTDADGTEKSQATILCKACGLCCTGHLFIWAKLRSAELDSAQSLGLTVFREPGQRGFNQPCPLWEGECTIYTSPHYPHFCRTYKCKLLKEVMDEITPLPAALALVQQAKDMIHELDLLLPDSQTANFRERLVAHIQYEENRNPDSEFLPMADELLNFYKDCFGVKDVVDSPDEK